MSENRYPQRKSPRLQGYDYSQNGAYFITICAYKMAHWFGHVESGAVKLNQLGQIAIECWAAIPGHFAAARLDVAVVMPNHMHGIIVLDGTGPALGTVVGTYKAAVTRQARREGCAPARSIWHTRYYDNIIRDELAFERIRTYILANPARWQARGSV